MYLLFVHKSSWRSNCIDGMLICSFTLNSWTNLNANLSRKGIMILEMPSNRWTWHGLFWASFFARFFTESLLKHWISTTAGTYLPIDLMQTLHTLLNFHIFLLGVETLRSRLLNDCIICTVTRGGSLLYFLPKIRTGAVRSPMWLWITYLLGGVCNTSFILCYMENFIVKALLRSER